MAVYNPARWAAALGGAVVGGGIASMHYTGMWALELPGRVTWMPGLVLATAIVGLAGFNTFVPLYALSIGMSGSRAVFALNSATCT